MTHLNRATAWLTLGDYARGWPEFDWRWRSLEFARRSLADDRRRWDGSPLAGRALLVYTEQGFGDAIQMLRFAPVIRAGGGRLVVRCGPTLAPLLRESSIADTVVTDGDSLPAFDVHAAIMSLPRLLGVTAAESLPGSTPHRSVSPARRALWQARLTPGPTRQVGICWTGDPNHLFNRRRSASPEAFHRMANEVGDITLVSLQYETPGASSAMPGINRLSELADDTVTLADTAAAMLSLDLVITVDTVTAHLAGALGVPVWILLAFAPDWRWMLDQTDTSWYDSARLFRQPARGDWDSVFSEVATALREPSSR